MRIKLTDIPEDGKEFDFSSVDKDFRDYLEDLVAKNPFEIHFDIRPLGNTYEIRGTIKTKLSRQCSLCANDIEVSLYEKFNESLIMGSDRDHSGVWSDSLSPKIASGQIFHAGEFAHEVIALADPIRPICKSDCKGLCLSCGVDLNVETCNCAKQNEKPHSPFSVLKSVKLN